MNDPFARSVSEIMTTQVATLRKGALLGEAASQLVNNRVSGMPVVDDDGIVVGVASLTDFVAALGAPHQPEDNTAVFFDSVRLVRLMDELLHESADGAKRTVADIMSSSLVAVRPDEPIRQAARTMAEKRVHRLLVLNGGGQLAGIVSALDLVGLI